MKRFLHIITILLFTLAILFASPNAVLASEEDGEHLEVEVSGYRITLTSLNGWIKGENTIVVTITDEMGMAVRDAEVEILIVPIADGQAASDEHGAGETDEHTESDSDGHGEPETDTHENEQEQDPMSDMDMDESDSESTEASAHDEESMDPVTLTESDGQGVYVAETHLESSGEHDIHVMFHVNGEILQANFVVDIPGTNSRTVVLWSFLLVNIALITSAGVLKNQSIHAKRQATV